MKSNRLVSALVFVVFLLSLQNASAQYSDWKHSGSLIILTTSEGVNLPSTISVNDFPLLVRLDKDFFDFGQAKPGGEDVRFSTADGTSLAFQIEQWDATGGTAAIWLRIPTIRGNSRQEIKMRWGNPDASSQSDGSAVFNASSGYASVWHMDGLTKDEVGTLATTDAGTTSVQGTIGKARHFPGKQGLFGGDKIPDYPSAGSPHSSEAWFRTAKTNTTVLAWGNEGGGRGSKVRMQFRSPPHIHIDSDFSDVNAESTLPMSQWIHVMHTYADGDGRIYINGRLDGSASPTLDIKRPARLWIGGWYHNYDFVGDIDEVRISRVARSADWIRLQYENQKPLQTLVGPLVQPGNTFSVSASQLTVSEGSHVAVTARAGGAEKVYWILKDADGETVVAVDRFAFTFDAGRVSSNEARTLRFKAVYADGVKIQDIPITIEESIPDPLFTLSAPNRWDGRETIEVSAAWKEDFPNIENYYIFQIWPAACGTVIDGSDNRLREKQRTLPSLYSNMGIMSTLGIRPGSSCHYPAAGYAEFARLICPLVQRDLYGKVFEESITPPDLIKAYFTNNRRDEIALEFDQPMTWEDMDAEDTPAEHFYLGGEPGKVASGTASGNVITLKLTEPSTAQQITYLDGKSWNIRKAFLKGCNGIAALTFCEVAFSDGDGSGN